MENIEIRNENKSDYTEVELLTREAFWNLYTMGCDEHYLVHIMRKSPDFIKELAFVATIGDKIIGNIMFTKSYVINKNDSSRIETLTFGPISVLPEFQRKGLGTKLINYSKKIALEMGYGAIIILGHPHNYCKHGFKVSKDFNISDSSGKYPFGLLVFELQPGYLNKVEGSFYTSPIYDFKSDEADEFDKQFEKKIKEFRPSQYEFQIACRAIVE